MRSQVLYRAAQSNPGLQCATGPIDTPEDDMLVIAVDGVVAYNQSASSEYVHKALT